MVLSAEKRSRDRDARRRGSTVPTALALTGAIALLITSSPASARSRIPKHSLERTPLVVSVPDGDAETTTSADGAAATGPSVVSRRLSSR